MRIVSLLTSATEILFAIGAGSEVAGITHECDFPPAAQHLPRLTSSALPAAGSAAEIDRHVRRSLHAGSSLYHLDANLLERLAPDIIVTQELCAVCAVSYHIVDRAAKRLSSDPRVISLEPSSLEDVYANIKTLGELTGHEREADSVVTSLRAREEAVRKRVAGRPRPRVALLEWTDPLMSAGHWTPGLIEAAGGTPVLCNSGGNSQRIEPQALYDADPDVVVVAPCGFDLQKTRSAVNALGALPGWNELRAVV
jgi:iron complex transport system substrate-binding protein